MRRGLLKGLSGAQRIHRSYSNKICPLTSRALYKEIYGVDLPDSLADDELSQYARRMNFLDGALCIHLNKSRDDLVGKGGYAKAKKVWALSVSETGVFCASPLVQTSTRKDSVKPQFPEILWRLSRSATPPLLPILRCTISSGKNGDKIHVLTPYCPPPSTLADRLRENRLTNAEIVQLFEELLQAVKFCHGSRVIHRDIRSANIFILNGHFLLGDFNLSLLDDSSSSDPSMDLYAIAQVIGHTIIRSLRSSIGACLYQTMLYDAQDKIPNQAQREISFRKYFKPLEQLYMQALEGHPLAPLASLLQALFAEQPPTAEQALENLQKIKEELTQQGAFPAVRETPDEKEEKTAFVLNEDHRALLAALLDAESIDPPAPKSTRFDPPSNS